MNWYRENRFLGGFLILFGAATVGALWFLLMANGAWQEASSRCTGMAAELNRLERLSPYPSGENLRKMRAHAEEYSSALAKLKEELKPRVAPVAPMAPSEFQSRLRIAVAALAEKARASKVKLPEKFYLGFDEFASTLPNETVAPFLGQELGQIEWFMSSLIDARVEAVTAFRRTPLPEEGGRHPAGAKSVERNVVEATFLSTPDVARKVINQVAGASQQFCIIRLLHIRNEKEKGPPREVAGETAGAPGKAVPGRAVHFIVGNERIETTARIEIVRFAL